MEPKSYYFWDIIIKGLTLIGIVASISVGIYWQNQNAKTLHTSTYWKSQLAVYEKLCETTGALSSYPPNSIEFNKASIELNKLYFGELYLYEDTSVSNAVVKLKKEISSLDTSKASALEEAKIKELTLNVSKQCRKSASLNWKILIDNFPNPTFDGNK